MELKFKVPKFRRGLNVTFRKASDKYLQVENGTELDLVETDGPPIGGGYLIEAIPLHWRHDQDVIKGLCRFEHDPHCHDIGGLAAAMNEAYGVNAWGPEVVALLFLVGNEVPEEPLVLTEGDALADLEDRPRPDNPTVPPTAESDSPPPPPSSDTLQPENSDSSSATEEPAPSEPQEDPVPRADEPESTPVTKVFTDRGGTDWGYKITQAGVVVLKRETDDLMWTEDVEEDGWPSAIREAVETLRS